MSQLMSTFVGNTHPSVPIAREIDNLPIPSMHPRRRRPRRARSPRMRSTRGGNPAVGILESASNVLISGGNFTTPQASVTVNIHPDRARDHSRRALSEEQHCCSSPNISSNPSGPLRRTEDAPVRAADSSPVSPIEVRGRKSSPEIYRNHLGKPQVRGRPLWIPQPNSQLPKEYRAKGALIGDIGIFTPEGGFDFLFNILRSSTDPVNPRKLPQGFSPLYPPLDDIDIRRFKEFGKGSYLSSSSVSQVQGGTSKESGTIFESSAAEGAILMMPDGASVEELSNLPIFREYIKENAERFYDYANNVRGREVKNGQLHVVYGCRKTASWGIATFSNTSNQSNLRLQFLSQHDSGSDNSISWEHRLHSGTADVKVGPDPEENEDLQGTEEGRKLNNQCLFASTLSIRLGNSNWKKRHPKKTVEVRDRSDSENDSPSSSVPSSNSQPSSQRTNNPSSPSNTGSRQRPRRGHNRSLQSISSSTDQPPSESESEGVILEQSSPASASVYHSEILTEYLLKMVPDANLAVASDKDWTGFIPPDDPAALIQNVCSMNNICEKDGVAFFEPKDYTAPKEDMNEIMRSLDSGKFDPQQYLFGSLQNRDTILNALADSLQLDVDLPGAGPDLPSILALAGHPRRLLSLDQIMDYHNCKLSRDPPAPSIHQLSVQELRNQLRKHLPTHPDSDRAQVIQNLADALLNRFIGLSQQDDLDEAIWLFEHALMLTPNTSYRHLEVLLGLSTSLYARLQLSRHIGDHERLFECLSMQRTVDLDGLLAPVGLALIRQPTSALSTVIRPIPVLDHPLRHHYTSSESNPDVSDIVHFGPMNSFLNVHRSGWMDFDSFPGSVEPAETVELDPKNRLPRIGVPPSGESVPKIVVTGPDLDDATASDWAGKTEHAEEMIGTGSFGQIYRGKWLEADVIALEGVPENHRVGQIEREQAIWPQLQHSHILQGVGDAVDVGADLVDKIEKSIVDLPHVPLVNAQESIYGDPTLDQLKLFHEINDGLIYLQSHSVPIHGDVKGSNIVIDGGSQIKLSDFGLSSSMNRTTNDPNANNDIAANLGSPHWMAPELVFGDPLFYEPGKLSGTFKGSQNISRRSREGNNPLNGGSRAPLDLANSGLFDLNIFDSPLEAVVNDTWSSSTSLYLNCWNNSPSETEIDCVLFPSQVNACSRRWQSPEMLNSNASSNKSKIFNAVTPTDAVRSASITRRPRGGNYNPSMIQTSQFHPLLAASSRSSITYDLALPHSATLLPIGPPLDVWHDTVMFPPLPLLKICCADLPSPVVAVSHGDADNIVTVGDVLAVLRNAFLKTPPNTLGHHNADYLLCRARPPPFVPPPPIPPLSASSPTPAAFSDVQNIYFSWENYLPLTDSTAVSIEDHDALLARLWLFQLSQRSLIHSLLSELGQAQSPIVNRAVWRRGRNDVLSPYLLSMNKKGNLLFGLRLIPPSHRPSAGLLFGTIAELSSINNLLHLSIPQYTQVEVWSALTGQKL